MGHLLARFVFGLISSNELKQCELNFAKGSSCLRQSNTLKRLVSRAPQILPLPTKFFH